MVVTKSQKETYELGRKLAGNLKPGVPVLLYGELGAGKTELIKGICAGLGYGGRVLSPTFQLVREYEISASKIYHVDLYRLEGGFSVESLGLQEIFEDKGVITLVEWADRIEREDLPEKYKKIEIEIVSENERKFGILDVD